MAEGQQQSFVTFRRAIQEDPIEKQVAAMKRLPEVILATGGAVAKDSIFPLIKEYIPGGDDEVLLAVAQNLDLAGNASECKDVLGTSPSENAWGEILEILEMLCAVEETVVREAAVASVASTLDSFLSPAQCMEAVVPLVDRLAKDEWFTARVSACALLTPALSHCSDPAGAEGVLAAFLKLAEDETPMVRRAIARSLAEFAEAVSAMPDGGEVLLRDVIPRFKALGMEDDASSVQHLAVQALASVAKLLDAEVFLDTMLGYVRWCAESPSWRIRSLVAPQFGKLCAVLGEGPAAQALCAEKLLPVFVGLLVDPERDVRAEACKGAGELHAAVGHGPFVQAVVPNLIRCTQDESHVVRNAYAEACDDILNRLQEADKAASSGGNDVAVLVSKTFVLLSDDHAEVRAKVMQAVKRVTEKAGESGELAGTMSEPFLSALQESAHDGDWRVRAAFTMQLPSLAKALGQSLFQKHFYEPYTTLIMDEVAAVRAATVDVIVPLADELEESWLHKVFLTGLISKMETAQTRRASDYLLFLNFAEKLCRNDEDERLVQTLLPFVREAVDYPIPNVQFCACNVLIAMAETLDPEEAITNLRPKIIKLVDSTDPDVSGAAALAMQAFKWSVKGDDQSEAKDEE